MSTGRLREWHNGVYLVDRDSVEPLGPETAAVLLFRGDGILSHRSAAAIWGLLETWPREVTLTVVGSSRRAPSGLRVHRVRTLLPRDLGAAQSLPLTSPIRTVQDLAVDASDAELEQAIAIARFKRLARPPDIRAAVERAPGRPGAPRLRRLLEGGGGYTRSKAERQLRSILRAAELPQPHANVALLGYVADFVWPDQKLIVEVDGYLFHSGRRAFEHDRRRDQRFAAAGYVVVRITWRQLVDEPYAVVARLAQALAARAA